jgi:hypothetical protein
VRAREFPAAALLAGVLLPLPAGAHSFGRMYNLPVPLWLYLYGAAAALLLSFLVVAWFVASPVQHGAGAGVELGQRPWLRMLRRLHLPELCRGLSLLGLLLCIASGLFGTQNPYVNFNMTAFWVGFVLGLSYLTALLGDLYAWLNPWRTLADAQAWLARRLLPGRRAPLRYPPALAWWPALGLYLAFIWIELFGYLKPLPLSLTLLAYTGLNLLGAALFGRAAWFRHGELFAVYLGLVARMAPLQHGPARSGLRLRWPFAALLDEGLPHLSLLLFVLFMLSSTAFDGLRETVPWVKLFWGDVYGLLKPWVGDNFIAAYAGLRPWFLAWESAALLLSPFLYLAVYRLFVWLMRLLTASKRSLRELALRFGPCLLPIALVYNVSHYYTLLLTQGVKLPALASDPLGRGWNLLGTRDWFSAAVIPDAGVVWHVQVGLIVLGHIVSVYLAHLEALRLFPERRRATLSQVPMLLLMVAFTTAGLWILSQPIKNG